MAPAPEAYSTVLYANDPDLEFDMAYYLKVHMPLCAKTWGSHGLQSWEVIQFETHPDGTKPPFAVQAILHWSKTENLEIVQQDISKPIFEDVKKFSNKMPAFLVGRWTGKST